MLRLMIFYLTLTAALFAPGVFAQNDVTSQNGVTATGQLASIAVSWTNTCTVCSWQLSTKYNNDPWVIQNTLPKGVTQYTITGLRPGQKYQVKMDAKRAARWVNLALLTFTTGKFADDGKVLCTPPEAPLIPSPPPPPLLLPLPPPYPQGSLDPTTQPFTLIATPKEDIKKAGGIIDVGGLGSTNTAAAPFVMQYTDGFANNFAQSTPAQNGVTATGGATSGGATSGGRKYIVVRWTNTCTVCSWRLSTSQGNAPWIIQAVLPKGITQYTIENLQPGFEYSVKLEAKRAARWVDRALLTVAPAATTVFTTRQKTVVPDSAPWGINTIFPWDVSLFAPYGYGTWYYGPGLESVKRTDIMQAGYSGPLRNTASLLNFFTMSDTHVYDKESPSQPFYVLMKNLPIEQNGIPAITYTMLYTTHILDAAIQTVNALHKQKPFDCGLFLGDAANNSQHNEVRWYIDVIDGKFITPSSAAHAGADTIDYQKPYKAAGLDKTIPWYQTKGSHDNFWFGDNFVTDYLRQNYIGEDILILGDGFAEPPISEPTYYMGTVDGSTPYGDIIGAGSVITTRAINVVADPNRYSLNMKDWMREFFDTSSNPVGHGFTQSNIDNNFASYSFEPKSNIPIKIIMLDDTQSESGPILPNYGNGSLDQARYDWLISELDKGQAEDKLMIIAAHVPIGVVPPPGSGTGSWGFKEPATYITDTQLIAKLHNYSNLILWLAGHQHNNQVTAFKSLNPNQPEQGFWEVQTASLRDFPQQFRTFEIVRNSDNTISIFATDVDTLVKGGAPAAISRSYAIAAQQLYKTPQPYLPTASYNVELVKQLNPKMQAIIQNLQAR